ncbi:MAG: phosphate ABC transporter permease PstA [Pseudomonadota bacterium]
MNDTKSFMRTWFASGEPWIWMNAAAVGISITAVIGILLLIAAKGFAHFWPSDVTLINYLSEQGTQEKVYGELVELDQLPVQQFLESGGNSDWASTDSENMARWLVKTGNRKIAPPDFRWIFEAQIAELGTPAGLLVVERIEWGNAYGQPVRLTLDRNTRSVSADENLSEILFERMARANEIRERIDVLESGSLNQINYRLERLRLEKRGIEITGVTQSQRIDEINREVDELKAEYDVAEDQLRELYEALDQDELVLSDAKGRELKIKLADTLHAWLPNDMHVGNKTAHYFSALWRFLTEDPREANTEGGIFPAIFGTILMVLLMSVMVTPFGVIAALYLREYAKQGPFVRIIRIAVNNLAGVPSIVYGVFGLGFFVYFLGGNLDRLFYPEALPAPTFGTPGLIWASLTLALLTVPVVIVSTEEGLTRIPRSLREGSLALGATKAETLFRIVLPMASPSILTGVILAVARAAGEVAPLMLVGVVKLAPTLPLDGNFPFLHLERKFMHLGFHIYDVGFQSPNVEAARPLVYATALLLVIIIIALNLSAITLRNRLEQRYKGVQA